MASLTHGDGQDLLASYKRGLEKRDPDALMGLFHDDAELRPDPFAEEMSGSNSIRAYWNEVCATQAHVEFDAERIWVSGATVLASWHAAFTRRRTAERVRVRGFMTLELDDDGLVRRARQWPNERVVGTDANFRAEGGDANGR